MPRWLYSICPECGKDLHTNYTSFIGIGFIIRYMPYRRCCSRTVYTRMYHKVIGIAVAEFPHEGYEHGYEDGNFSKWRTYNYVVLEAIALLAYSGHSKSID